MKTQRKNPPIPIPMFRRGGFVPGILAVLCLACSTLQAANYTMSSVQNFGADWNTGSTWSSGLSATSTIASDPLATFETLPGARLRTPDAALTATFPGTFTNSVKVTGNSVFQGTALTSTGVSEIRYKQANNTDNGVVTIANLILNGGQLDVGNDMTAIMDGRITVNANTTNYIYGDSTGNDRGARLNAYLTGSGTLVLNGGRVLATAAVPGTGNRCWNIAGTSNTFTGKWIVTRGLLLGSGANSLGTNTITIQTDGGLETLYDVYNPKGNLIINGNAKVYLHQSNCFQSIIINGVGLPMGTYSFAYLNSTYPNNFPSSWAALSGLGYLGAEAYQTGSGYLTVLSGNVSPVTFNPLPANVRVLLGQTARFAPGIDGPADSIQWYSNNVAIPDATNLVYITAPTTSGNNNDVYKIVVSNNINTTNASATLTIGTLVYSPGFLKKEFYQGGQYNATNIDTTTDSPGETTYLTRFELPVNVGDNFAERISGFFIPAVTTNYTFFVCSDNDSFLSLSTDSTTNNLATIARETLWSNNRQWLNSAGFSDVTLKRSDQFTPDGGATFPFASGIPLVAGQQYYFQGNHHEGGGLDNFSATFIFAGSSDPADGSLPAIATGLIACYAIDGNTLSITNQPQNKTVTNGFTATFSVGFQSSTTNIIYQWQRAGTNIPNATASSYTTPPVSASDNNSQYRIVIGIPGLAPVTSSAATLTVVSDTTPPALAEIPGTLINTNGATEISVIYNEQVSATALNAANYHLNSGSISGVRAVTNSSGMDRNWAGFVLTTTGLTAGNTYTLNITNVADTFGNVIAPVNVSVSPSRFNRVALGNTALYVANGLPVFPSEALAVGNNGFNLVNAGESFTNDTDDLTFVYERKTNNFDVKAQIERIDSVGFLSAAGLMVRETIEPAGSTAGIASRFQSISVTPVTDYLGNAAGNRIGKYARLTTGGLKDDPTTGTFVNPLPGPYPNIWVRLKRTLTGTNDVISMYVGTDGTNWSFYGSQTFSPALPTEVFVGSYFGAWVDQIDVANAREFTARVRNYADLSIVPRIQNVTSAGAGQISFGVPTISGYTYTVEYKNFLADPTWTTLQVGPGTGGVLTVNDNSGPATRFYRVSVQ